MKSIKLVLVIISISIGINELSAQNSGISSSLGLYIFPSNNQDAQTQEADEAACFAWAKEQTGYDPLNPPTVTAAHVDKSADGTAVKSTARGAAGGAAIGAIAGDAGKGAAIGSAVGGIRGVRAKKGNEQAREQANQQAAANHSTNLANDYKKAYSVCMEGKGYTIK